MKVLVLGGYGLIGSSIVRRLIADGHAVTGLGRSAAKGVRVSSQAKWVSADLTHLTKAADWADLVSDTDIVINAAGLLQNGLTDRVSTVQTDSICAVIDACKSAGIKKFIQISAPGVSEESSTEFYRSKAHADAYLKESGLAHLIFRPGLVISPHAYGGTSLVRMLAAFPLVQPVTHANTLIQTVSVSDVANAVSMAVSETSLTGDFDLVAEDTLSLETFILSFRSWLGFGQPIASLKLPVWLGNVVAVFADMSGWLGWRSALRSTAMKVLTDGVTGNARIWRAASGENLQSLDETLASIPSTAQERLYARGMLVYPVLLIIFAMFWVVSGIIGFWQFEAAYSVIDARVPPAFGKLFVLGDSVADILIGLALLFRPWTQKAAIAAILLSLGYIGGSMVTSPHLWVDPLGPMVKVFPAIALGLAIAALTPSR